MASLERSSGKNEYFVLNGYYLMPISDVSCSISDTFGGILEVCSSKNDTFHSDS